MNDSNTAITANDSNTSNSTQKEKCDYFLQLFVEIEKYFGPALLLFGIICNILALFTLRQPKLKESPFIHLMGLTVTDLCALVLILIHVFAIYTDRTWSFFIYYIYYPITNIGSLFCVWIMVIMTLERCIFMQFPLWAPIWCTNSSAKFKIVLVFAICVVVSIPRFFWYQVSSDCCYLATRNETCNINNTATFCIKDNLDGNVLGTCLSWIYSVIHNFLPVTILLVLNCFLIYKIRAQNKRRIQLGIHHLLQLGRIQEQNRLTITLIAITGIYIALVLPNAFADWNIAIVLFRKNRNHLALFQHISNFLVWLNLSFNFLMYTFVNAKFMRAFKKMLSRWLSQLYQCVSCFRISQRRFHKKNSSTAAYRDKRTKEYPQRPHPGPLSGWRSCSSRLLTSRGFI